MRFEVLARAVGLAAQPRRYVDGPVGGRGSAPVAAARRRTPRRWRSARAPVLPLNHRLPGSRHTARATVVPVAFLAPRMPARARPSSRATSGRDTSRFRYSKIRSSSPAPTGTFRQTSSGNSRNEPTSETITALPSPSARSSVPELSPTVGIAQVEHDVAGGQVADELLDGREAQHAHAAPKAPWSGSSAPAETPGCGSPTRIILRVRHQPHQPAERAQRFGDALVRLQKAEDADQRRRFVQPQFVRGSRCGRPAGSRRRAESRPSGPRNPAARISLLHEAAVHDRRRATLPAAAASSARLRNPGRLPACARARRRPAPPAPPLYSHSRT